MRVLNQFKIPYIVIHDEDPIDFLEDKPDKNDKEKQELKTFKENEFIEATLDQKVGKIIKVKSEFEDITGVSRYQTDKHGKVQAAYNKYDGLDVNDYPDKLRQILDLITDWDIPDAVCEIVAT